MHARHQVLSFAIESEIDVDRLLRFLGGQLAPEITPLALVQAADDFDARFSARWRSYRYQILNRSASDPLRRNQVWHVSQPLASETMDVAAQALIGEHDFAAFCRAPRAGGTTRRLLQVSCRVEGDMVLVDLKANAFCHQMVRSVVGLLVEVGLGKRAPFEVAEVLAGRDRSRIPNLAPARGLILWEVGYEEGFAEPPQAG